MNEFKKYAQEMVEAIDILWRKNLLAAGDGNFSFKLDEPWITPSGVRKCKVRETDFVKLNSSSKASSESSMHQVVFEHCERAKVVFHAHPPAAIAWSICSEKEFLPSDLVSELILSVGAVPIAPYARPGTLKMGEVLKPYLPKHRVIILKNHGALTWGESVEEALNGMERLEHYCEILLKVKSLGGATQLSKTEVGWLTEKRKELGERVL